MPSTKRTAQRAIADIQIGVRIEQQLRQQLQAIADREERSLAQVLRLAIRAYVENWSAKNGIVGSTDVRG
jgi:metal-responsive CopG/Arc/MetJ family transcriptional regulator